MTVELEDTGKGRGLLSGMIVSLYLVPDDANLVVFETLGNGTNVWGCEDVIAEVRGPVTEIPEPEGLKVLFCVGKGSVDDATEVADPVPGSHRECVALLLEACDPEAVGLRVPPVPEGIEELPEV